MARLPLPAFSSYAAAKHALRGFLNTLRIEEREQGTGVRVAMVSPGLVNTPVYERATGATGRRPVSARLLRGHTVAAALVTAALAPRRERIVGAESKLVDLLYGHARPAAELLLLFVDRWSRTGTDPAGAPGALWEPMEKVRASGGIPSRRKGDLVMLARHIGGAAVRAIGIAPALLRPVPERHAASARAISALAVPPEIAQRASHDGVSDRGPHRPGDEAPIERRAPASARSSQRATSSRRRGRRRPKASSWQAQSSKALPRSASRSSWPRARLGQRRDAEGRRARPAPPPIEAAVSTAPPAPTRRARQSAGRPVAASRTDQAHRTDVYAEASGSAYEARHAG